jgi:hypothetical protein
MLRMIAMRLGIIHSEMELPSRIDGSEGLIWVPLGSLSGYVDECGHLVQGLGPLDRALFPAWARAYGDDVDEEGGSPLMVVEDSGKLYLDGGSIALLRVEIARARGESHVRASIARSASLCAMASEKARCASVIQSGRLAG